MGLVSWALNEKHGFTGQSHEPNGDIGGFARLAAVSSGENGSFKIF